MTEQRGESALAQPQETAVEADPVTTLDEWWSAVKASRTTEESTAKLADFSGENVHRELAALRAVADAARAVAATWGALSTTDEWMALKRALDALPQTSTESQEKSR